MRQFEVAVIGSGPAGAACALRLANSGISTALVDPQTFPRPKLCGEYLNLGAIRELRDLGLDRECEADAAPLHGMRLFAHDEAAEFRLSSEAWSLPRTTLDERIRSSALRAGAHPVVARVRALVFGTDGVEVRLSDPSGSLFSISAHYVIGADGMRSTVAKLCNLTLPVRDRRFAIGGHFANAELGGWIEMYAGDGEYLALNPVSAGCANGVFVVAKERLQRSRGKLPGELASLSTSLTGARRVVTDGFAKNAHAIGPLAHRTVRPIAKRVLLVGDAAAFVDPFTGQGVYLALSGARIAAEAIERALWRPRDERLAWESYAGRVCEAVRERDRVAAMMKMMLKIRFAGRRAARALRRRPGDFTFLIEAVCGNIVTRDALQLAAAVGKVLR